MRHPIIQIIEKVLKLFIPFVVVLVVFYLSYTFLDYCNCKGFSQFQLITAFFFGYLTTVGIQEIRPNFYTKEEMRGFRLAFAIFAVGSYVFLLFEAIIS